MRRILKIVAENIEAYLNIYNANFCKNHMSSIRASIFKPEAPKFRVVGRYKEEMVIKRLELYKSFAFYVMTVEGQKMSVFEQGVDVRMCQVTIATVFIS